MMGCSRYTYTRNLSLSEGSFEVTRPPIIDGVKKELTTFNNNEISADISFGKNQSIPLNSIEQNDSTIANIEYDLTLFTFGLQYKRLQKFRNHLMVGGGGGLMPYPYVFAIGGINTKHFEFGINAHLGVGYGEVNYAGTAHWEKERGLSNWDLYDDFDNEAGDTTFTAKDDFFHFYIGAGFFTSIYVFNFALSYSGTIVEPEFYNYQLPAPYTFHGSNEYTIDIPFPYLYMHNVGISRTIQDKYQIEFCVLHIVGSQLKKEPWAMDIKLSYIF